MRKGRHAHAGQYSRQLVTTIGDLISAAYDVAGGAGASRTERAAALLSSSLLARRLSRQLRFVR